MCVCACMRGGEGLTKLKAMKLGRQKMKRGDRDYNERHSILTE